MKEQLRGLVSLTAVLSGVSGTELSFDLNLYLEVNAIPVLGEGSLVFQGTSKAAESETESYLGLRRRVTALRNL